VHIEKVNKHKAKGDTVELLNHLQDLERGLPSNFGKIPDFRPKIPQSFAILEECPTPPSPERPPHFRNFWTHH
jgi:hypothetical protein